MRELEALGFSLDEWELLNLEHTRLAHAARLLEGARRSLALLSEGEAACEEQLDILPDGSMVWLSSTPRCRTWPR